MARDLFSNADIVPNALNGKTYTFTGRASVDINTKITDDGNRLQKIGQQVERAISSANETISQRLADALDQAMRSQVWGTSGGNADIIDSGALSASLNVTVSGTQINVSYGEPYANLVHYGGYILPYGNASLEKVYVPPRPWVQSVLQGGGPVPRFDFESIYRQAIAQVFR
jgi:hypothetical protein